MTSHPSAMRSLNESFMNHWNVAGEFMSPKNMTVGLKSPLCVMKVAFHWCLSLIQTLLYPQWTLNLVKTLAPLSLSTRSEMRIFLSHIPSLICHHKVLHWDTSSQ